MTIHLIGGKHSDSLEKWEKKIPDKNPDKVAVEAFNEIGEINRETARIILQPISALIILAHDLLRLIFRKMFGRLSNDQKVGQETGSKYDVNVLSIDAPPIWKINEIPVFSMKTVIDWVNILMFFYFLMNSVGAVILLLALNLIFQPILTIYIFRDIRDEYMSNMLLEHENETFFVFTGSLHSLGIAGILLSKEIDVQIHI